MATEQTSLSDYPPLPDNLTRAQVVRVVDSDTIIVRIGRKEERVQLIGINTPESVDPRRPVECFRKKRQAMHANSLTDKPSCWKTTPHKTHEIGLVASYATSGSKTDAWSIWNRFGKGTPTNTPTTSHTAIKRSSGLPKRKPATPSAGYGHRRRATASGEGHCEATALEGRDTTRIPCAVTDYMKLKRGRHKTCPVCDLVGECCTMRWISHPDHPLARIMVFLESSPTTMTGSQPCTHFNPCEGMLGF